MSAVVVVHDSVPPPAPRSRIGTNPYKPLIRQDPDGQWVLLLGGRWRYQPSWRAAVDTALDHCDEHSPGCGIAGCPCRRPGPVCAEWMGLDGMRFCPLCGWSKRMHAEETS